MDDTRLKVGIIHTIHKEKLIYVAEFTDNKDTCHIVEQGNKWMLLRGVNYKGQVSISLTEKVMEVLKLLPNKPYNHKPFMQYLSRL